MGRRPEAARGHLPDAVRVSRARPVVVPGLVLVLGVGVASAATVAWTALGLAALGRFDAATALGAGAAVAALAMAIGLWAIRGGRLAVACATADRLADAACGVIVVLGALRLQPAVPWPAALDGGWYAAAAVRIAQDRSLTFDAPAAAIEGLATPLSGLRSIGIQAPPDRRRGLHAVAFAVPRLGEPRVTPYHPPLFTALAAVGVARVGPYGSAWAAIVAAVLWLLAVAALGRAAGLTIGAAAACALCALSPAFTVYGAAPYAELFASTLGLAALAATVIVVGRRAGAVAPPLDVDEHTNGRADAFGTRPRLTAWAASACAGLAVGSAVVAKIDLTPFALALALTWMLAVRPRRLAAAFAAGAALPAAAFVGLIRGPTAVYAALNGFGVWRLAMRGGALTVVVVLAALVSAVWIGAALVAGRRGRRRGPGSAAAPRPVEGDAGIGRGDRGQGHGGRWWTPGGLTGAAIVAAAARQWWTASGTGVGMLRLLGWAVTPLALFAAAVALGWIVDHRRRVPPAVWPLLAATAFVVVAPIVTTDLSPMYTLRRLAPIALPTVGLLAGGWIERAVGGARSSGRAVVAALAALSLAVLAQQSAGVRPSREFAAVELLLDRIAAYARPGDLAVFPDAYAGDLSARLAAPLWALHGVDVAVLAADERTVEGPSTAAAEALRRWWTAHPTRRVLWVAAPSTPAPAGLAYTDLGAESIISEAWAPGRMPPLFTPLELSVTIGTLAEVADNSR